MSGLLARLRGWVRRRLPGGGVESDGADGPDSTGGPDEEAVSTGEPAGSTDAAPEYGCRVCGTEVRGPDKGCPLCRSTDVRPVAELEGAASAGGGTDGRAGEDPTGLDPGRARTTRVAADGNDPAERLRRLRERAAGSEVAGTGAGESDADEPDTGR